MKHLFLANQHPSRHLLLSGLLVIACWLVFQVFSITTGILLFNIPIIDISLIFQNLTDPKSIGFIKYIQALTSFGMFVVSSLIIAAASSKDWMNYLKLDKKPATLPLLISVMLMIFILPFTNLIASLNSQISLPEGLSWLENFFRSKEEQMTKIMESFLNVKGLLGLSVNLLIIAIIPAIGEELIFRGIVQDRFSDWFKNHHLAILLTAFIFSALHLQFLSFFPRFFLGIILGYLFVWSGSIWLTIFAHFVNNAFAVLYYYLYYNGKVEKSIELIGTPHNGLIYAALSFLMGGVLLYCIYRILREKGI